MSATYIPAALRQQVRARAGGQCEYCLLAEEHAYLPHEPDHIIAEKHGGETTALNLVLACFDCNRFKGSDIASIDPISSELVPLFNPRTHAWREHFHIEGGRILPLTPIGRVIERVLRLNLVERVEIRETLAQTERYP